MQEMISGYNFWKWKLTTSYEKNETNLANKRMKD